MDDHKLTPEEEAFAQNLKNEFERKKAKSLIKYVQQEQRENVKQDTLLMGDLTRKYLRYALMGILIIAVAALLIMIGIKIGSSDKDSVTPPQSQTALVAPKPIIKDTVFAVILSKTELSDEAERYLMSFFNDTTVIVPLNSMANGTSISFKTSGELNSFPIKSSSAENRTINEIFNKIAENIEKSHKYRKFLFIGNLSVEKELTSGRTKKVPIPEVFTTKIDRYKFIIISDTQKTDKQVEFEKLLKDKGFSPEIIGAN